MASDRSITEKQLATLLEAMEERLKSHVTHEVEKNRVQIVEGRDMLLKSIHRNIDELKDRLDNLELNTPVSRKEFDEFKRETKRLSIN